MFKKNIKFLLPFAAFVTVIPCPALHCRPGTFWTYPLIFTLMLLSCLLASAAVFLFRRSALFLLLPLGGYLFGSLLYFIVSGRWYKWPEAVFLAVFILPALGVGALFFAGIGLMRRGKRKIVPGLLCALLALFLILSAASVSGEARSGRFRRNGRWTGGWTSILTRNGLRSGNSVTTHGKGIFFTNSRTGRPERRTISNTSAAGTGTGSRSTSRGRTVFTADV